MCLPFQRSDHSPLVIDTHWVDMIKHRPKRFEEVWLKDDGVKQIIARVWAMSFSGSMTFQLVQKQNVPMRHLHNWGNLSHRRLGRKMAEICGRLENIQRANVEDCVLDPHGGSNVGLTGLQELVKEDKTLRGELDNLVDQEELFWAQRAKQRWLELGNKNSRQEKQVIEVMPQEGLSAGVWLRIALVLWRGRHNWLKLLWMVHGKKICAWGLQLGALLRDL